MNLENLKPTDVLRKIRRRESRIALNKMAVKLWRERQDPDQLKTKIDKQLAIIDEANAKIAKLRDDASNADAEIAKNERSIRYDEKRLAELRNRNKILKLLRLVAQVEGDDDA